MTLERLRMAGAGPQAPLAVALQGAYNEQAFQVEGTVGPLAALFDPRTPWPLAVRATVGEATVTVDGTVQDVLQARGLSIAITAQGPSIAAVPGPFALSGQIADVGSKAYRVSHLQAVFPRLEVSGTAEVSLAGTRPQLTAQQERARVRPPPLGRPAARLASAGVSHPGRWRCSPPG